MAPERRSIATRFLVLAGAALLTSCAEMAGDMLKGMLGFDRESRRERQVREDTANQRAGRPLRHFSSEKRLDYARDDVALDRLRRSMNEGKRESAGEREAREFNRRLWDDWGED